MVRQEKWNLWLKQRVVNSPSGIKVLFTTVSSASEGGVECPSSPARHVKQHLTHHPPRT